MEKMHPDERLQRVSPTKYNELKLRFLSEKPAKTFSRSSTLLYSLF